MKKKILLGLMLLIKVINLFSQEPNINCTPYDAKGIQYCEVGIPSTIIDVVGFDTQQMNQWCWAASIQAVFNYYGHEISQDRIVSETFGTIVNWPAQPYQILTALNRTWIDDDGNYFNVHGESYSANCVTAAQDLASGYPLIIGTLGHAMVLTALSYYRDFKGNGWIQSATVRDPWPLNPRRRILSAHEWISTSFLVRIHIN
jgi:hypothetical protein